MKKLTKDRIKLSTTTLRPLGHLLSPDALAQIAGGLLKASAYSCGCITRAPGGCP
jgi:hypothetical protein